MKERSLKKGFVSPKRMTVLILKSAVVVKNLIVRREKFSRKYSFVDFFNHKNIKTILSSQALQHRQLGWIWPVGGLLSSEASPGLETEMWESSASLWCLIHIPIYL